MSAERLLLWLAVLFCSCVLPVLPQDVPACERKLLPVCVNILRYNAYTHWTLKACLARVLPLYDKP